VNRADTGPKPSCFGRETALLPPRPALRPPAARWRTRTAAAWCCPHTAAACCCRPPLPAHCCLHTACRYCCLHTAACLPARCCPPGSPAAAVLRDKPATSTPGTEGPRAGAMPPGSGAMGWVTAGLGWGGGTSISCVLSPRD